MARARSAADDHGMPLARYAAMKNVRNIEDVSIHRAQAVQNGAFGSSSLRGNLGFSRRKHHNGRKLPSLIARARI